MEKVLVTGAASGGGRLVVRTLAKAMEVVAVDRSRWPGRPPRGVRFHQADIQKRPFGNILRTESPDVVVHMDFIRHFREDPKFRHEFNVRGTKSLLDQCAESRVRKLVVVSNSYVYGADPRNPYAMDEGAPLSGSRSYPEIRDLVEVDALASAFLWRVPEVETSVLRPVNVLGPAVQSMAKSYLLQKRVPTVAGFDPMMQFIHEEDFARALALAVAKPLRGVFNVVGPGAVPLHTAIREAGSTAWALPGPLLRRAFHRLFRWGILPFPPGMLDYLKYPVSLSGRRFAAATGFQCRYGLPEIFDSVRD